MSGPTTRSVCWGSLIGLVLGLSAVAYVARADGRGDYREGLRAGRASCEAHTEVAQGRWSR